MSPSEIHTAVELELDRYVVLVWANEGGALIGAGVAQQRIAVPEGVWHWGAVPDFSQVARGFGALGITCRDAESLHRALFTALRGAGPVVIEAKIDPAIAIPAGDRFLALGGARS